MTSPPRPLASAEHSSELRESAHLQPQQPTEENKPEYIPPAVSSAGTTPLSSISSPPQTSLAYGSSHLSVNVTPTTSAFPAPGARQELPSRSAKRTASSTELRSPKSRRDSQGSHQLSSTPSTSTGAQFTPAPHHQAPDRATGRARAPASVGPQSPTYTRESQAGKRGRARKNPLHQADSRSSAGPRVDDDGDVPMSMLSPRSHTSRLLDLPPLPFHSTSRVPTPSEGLSAGPSSSSGYRRKAGASFPNSPSLVALSPSLSTGEFYNPPFSVASRSAFPRPPLTPSRPSTLHTPLSAGKCFTSPSSPSLPYGSPGIPTSPPPYHNLPALNSVFKQAPVQPSVEADGFMIIRNAISLPLIRDIVAMIAKGLQVVSMSETIQTYALPLQAYQVRDEFVTRWRPALRPFYDPMGKNIPKMPSQTQLCAFRASDPTNVNQSLLNIGGKNLVLVHIALTELSPQTGFYNILRGSHQSKHPTLAQVNDWSPTPVTLLEGDAIVWRGDVSYFRSPNGGGIWQCLNFDWGPGMVDLTNE